MHIKKSYRLKAYIMNTKVQLIEDIAEVRYISNHSKDSGKAIQTR